MSKGNTVNQFLKYRKKVLAGKDKYYPEDLKEAVYQVGRTDQDRLQDHYRDRDEKMKKENRTESNEMDIYKK